MFQVMSSTGHFDYMKEALLSEGFGPEKMGFSECWNIRTKWGFFSVDFNPDLKYPVLTHFFIDKDKRSAEAAREQFRLFTAVLIKANIPFFIVEAPVENPSVERFIHYIGGKRPYQTVGDDKIFYVPTGYRMKRRKENG